MTTAINKIISNFPNPHLDPIMGQPSYDTVHQLHLQLNSKAASIHSDLGNGQLGLHQLTVSIEVYNTLSTTPFVVPANPGTSASIPCAAESTAITKLNRAHDAATYLFNQ
jgi:hypothetical protein